MAHDGAFKRSATTSAAIQTLANKTTSTIRSSPEPDTMMKLILAPPILAEGNHAVFKRTRVRVFISSVSHISKPFLSSPINFTQTFGDNLGLFTIGFQISDCWGHLVHPWTLLFPVLRFFALIMGPEWVVAFKSMLVCFNVFYMMCQSSKSIRSHQWGKCRRLCTGGLRYTFIPTNQPRTRPTKPLWKWK